AWARSDPSIVRAKTRIAYKKRGLRIDESAPEFREAAMVVLKAHIRAYELMGERQRGKIVETPAPPATPDRAPKLSEALASWDAGGTSGRGNNLQQQSMPLVVKIQHTNFLAS